MGGIIPKAALGRGLGSLMKKPGRPLVTPEQDPLPLLSPGMATLLRGNGNELLPQGNGKPAEPTAAVEPECQARPDPLDPDELATRRLYQCSLFLADVLLLMLAAWIVFGNKGPFGLMEAFLCTGAVAAGAWLSCLAFWME